MIPVVALFLLLSTTTSLPQSHVSPHLPLGTAAVGSKVVVVDAAGTRVKLACVNWYGAHMEGHVVNGLDKQPINAIANTIKDLGFNCVRLPFSLEQFYDNPVVESSHVSANPQLEGETSLSVLD